MRTTGESVRLEDWHLGCPRCGAEVETVSISCGRDGHRTYRCLNFRACGWHGRSGLTHGSPLMVCKVRDLDSSEGGECDWGGCDKPAVAARYESKMHVFLPVCAEHRGEQ